MIRARKSTFAAAQKRTEKKDRINLWLVDQSCGKNDRAGNNPLQEMERISPKRMNTVSSMSENTIVIEKFE